MWIKVIFIVAAVVNFGSCHSTGAPTQACTTLTPNHGVAAQNTPPPYHVVVPLQVQQGQTMTVTIANREPGFTFRGFIIQARSVNTQAVVGRFLITNNMGTVACPTLPTDSVATHSNPSDKSSVALQWVAPTNFNGLVFFQ